jgi:alkylhydroperoxidase family enzyme
MTERLPLLDMPADVSEELARVGGEPINLYRALANAPEMLRAYLKLSWGLRLDADTPRALRELLILRGAQVAESEYEWRHHVRMARAAGVPDQQIDALHDWRNAGDTFSAPERAALALAEDVTRGSVSDDTAAELAHHFSEAERVELILTGSFYAMVARLLDAMGVPLEADLAAEGNA